MRVAHEPRPTAVSTLTSAYPVPTALSDRLLLQVALKTELIHRQPWPTTTHARRAVFDFIEVFYNRQRMHSSLDYLSPADYEATLTQQPIAAQAA